MTLLLAGVMSMVVLLASGTAWAITGWVSGRLNRDDVFAGLLDADRPEAGPRGALNILVIGSDGRGDMQRERQDELGVGHTDGQRSDTMMLVHVNNDRDQITVVGIPRDSWVQIPGHGGDKINAAYAYGGPQLAIQTVELASRVRIDHYVEVNFSGFVDVVDALGTITVCLPEAIQDEKAHLDMAAGTHEVDGAQALAFARTRKTSDGDLDRIDRQQQVLAALLNKALSTETLTDPAKFTRFLDSSLSSVTVDEGLDTTTINQLGNQLSSITLDDVSFTQVPIGQLDYWTPNGDLAIKWHEERAREMFTKISRDEPLAAPPEQEAGAPTADEAIAPGEIALEVFNGVGTPGLGSTVRTELTTAGFAVAGEAQNWPTRDVAESLVRYAPGQEAAARAVLEAVPGARLEEDATLAARVQLVVGFNYTRVAAPAAGSVPEPSAEASAPDGTGSGGRDSVNTTTAAENICG
ncbi:LytR family transcriptional regulator [Nocardiopsis ansamitocini]|uniref:LytR family transcriptional regulator n=1 Tax=Nocardiopsis ansamitocini TaxID=1670832 RepID=A0A9W6P9Q4_9ACTN|nr:LytR family transcriptional regulator [Nocardiopsis ansamitocini]